MGEGRCAAAKAHRLAKIVATASAKVALAAHNASLDGDAVTDDEVSDARTDCSHDACGLMTEDKRLANGEITVATVFVIVN
jgi:hypothetical protein